MIGYAVLVLIAFVTLILGSIVVGVAVWGWNQEKKAARAASAAATGSGVDVSVPPSEGLKKA